MSELRQRIEEFQKRAERLNEKAKQINSNLFLFDEYCPKKCPADIENEEILFWYLIVDLYGLFFDSGRYLCYLPFWTESNIRNTVKAFYKSLNEIRSVFCHNKPISAYMPELVTDSNLDRLVANWHDLLTDRTQALVSRTKPVPFGELSVLFLDAANKMLNWIDGQWLYHLKKVTEEELIVQWFIPIVKWYWVNGTIYTRTAKIFNIREKAKNNHSCQQFKNIDGKDLKDRISRHLILLQLIPHGLHSSLTDEQLKNYGINIYNRRFCRQAKTAERRELTPFNLFEPLLSNNGNNSGVRSLFAPSSKV